MGNRSSAASIARPGPEARAGGRGADALALALAHNGVDTVMGVTGGCIMEQMDAFAASGQLRLCIFETEPGAAWAAVGYARATGRPGVCAVTSGPGATNTITALADAHRDNVPLIVITGQVGSGVRNTDAFQEVDIVSIARPVCKRVYYLADAADISTVVAGAVEVATSGRPGPVLIDITRDCQQGAYVGTPEWDAARPPAVPTRDAEPSSSLDEVAALLATAQRPVILVGYGVVIAGVEHELRELLGVVPCPVVHSLPGKSALPSDHPLNYGMVGMHGWYAANWSLEHADLVIAFGARYDDRITSDPTRFAPHATRLVHFDIDPAQIHKTMAERKLGVVGDLRVTLPALRARVVDLDLHYDVWHGAIRAIEAERPSTYVQRHDVLQAQYVLEAVNHAVRRLVAKTGQRVIFTTEIGSHQMWAGQHLRLERGWSFYTSSGQGAMGSGLPMALGAQLAHPDALVICITGDGSLRFAEAELETIQAHQLPVKVLALNNGGYGIVRMWNHRFYGGRETGVVKKHKDWQAIALGNGFAGQCGRIETRDDVSPVLMEILASREPYFAEFMTEYEDCLPLIPPGRSIHETLFT